MVKHSPYVEICSLISFACVSAWDIFFFFFIYLFIVFFFMAAMEGSSSPLSTGQSEVNNHTLAFWIPEVNCGQRLGEDGYVSFPLMKDLDPFFFFCFPDIAVGIW